MESNMYDHDAFLFKRRINNNKRNTFMNRNKSALNKKHKSQTPSQHDLPDTLPITLDTTSSLPPLLKKYTLYIHKSLQYTTLTTLAEGLGATVRTEMNKSITHLIIDPKGDSRQLRMINQAVSKGIVCVSPKWIMMCYTDRTLYPPTDFQYDIDESINVLDRPSQPQTTMYNPFNTTYIDFDELEKTRPLEGGQLRLDGFISRTRDDQHYEEQAKIECLEEEEEDKDDYYPTIVEKGEPSIDNDDDKDAIREFYYNNNNNNNNNNEDSQAKSSEPKHQESAEELEAKRIRSEQRSLQLQKVIEQRRLLMKQKEDTERQETRKRRVVPNIYNEKRVHVWYGEHFAKDKK
ncbi:uncharacterized protein BX663DRAFT_544785 [Cokeromyces recurvatus]|uniref:uncharacterized protein n=1 Tax=Cokeromyces recurvatus TaxID=90255 RepID=UPI00221ECD0D|nr:uncharacterized protein BX663DRAFT_544785 [Cokeromyces recurvatus]KAI7900627.1 hypothetical protein BX663DRAFT_544785 [Cokeromyces recurvatus]